MSPVATESDADARSASENQLAAAGAPTVGVPPSREERASLPVGSQGTGWTTRRSVRLLVPTCPTSVIRAGRREDLSAGLALRHFGWDRAEGPATKRVGVRLLCGRDLSVDLELLCHR